jgi:two-component system alkaline phosphatase synthesis response regulator PhoP
MQKVLVVEDEQMLAKIIGMKLEEEKFEVVHAYDGEEAYNILSKSEGLPDLVLLDVLLPKMSGFDVLEKLRQENKSLPKVIVFSNFAQKADVERAHALGAVDYIVKAAFSPAEILSKIKALFAEGGAAASEKPKESAPSDAPASPAENGQGSAYQSFESMQDVMPMSEVLRPGEPNNNP